MITKSQLSKESKLNEDRIEANRFNVIYTDPPWRFKNWSMDELAKRGEKWARRNGRSPYNVMDQTDICALPVERIAAKNSILLLWATYPKLPEALEAMGAWGFAYKTVAFTWVKLNPSGIGFKFGLGYHTRGNPEICLLGSKGKGLRRVDNSIPNLTISPVGEHSKKPDEIRDKIERLYGNVPKIELFARNSTPGWTALGNEIGERKSLQESLIDVID